MLIEASPYNLKKTRYTHDGWEVDFFHGPLEGLILVERELETADENVEIPEWMSNFVEVTDTLTNKQLAITSHLLQGGELNIKELCTHVKTIVLTGAPGAGKSTIIKELQDDKRFLCVPEIATMIMSQVGVRPDIGEAHFNTMLFNVQISIEEAIKKQATKLNKEAIILDRGVLDSAAFMKHGLDALNVLCKTTTEKNYARYDAVIQLAVPPEDVYNKIRANNSVRTESFDQAANLELKIYEAWAKHPNFRMLYDDGITSCSIKSARIKEILNELLA
jgi:predicted ATPase